MKSSSHSYKLVPFLVVSFIISVEVAISFNSTLLPNLKGAFAVSEATVQATVAIGLFAIGLSGIIYGGLTDSFGRRPIFLMSTALFSVTSLICAMAPNIYLFLVARLLQGFGSGAGWIVGNACLSDIYQGKTYIRVMNYAHAVAAITPAVAPVIGSYIATYIDWRYCFWLLGFTGLVTVFLMWRYQPETLKEKQPLCYTTIKQRYWSLLGNRTYLVYCSIKVVCVTLLFNEITTIPLVFVDYLGISEEHYGWYILPGFVMYVIASSLSAQLTEYVSTTKMILAGVVLTLVNNVLILLAPEVLHQDAMTIQIMKLPSYFAFGLIFGNATAKIVGCVPGYAAVASAVMIATEMLFSSIGISALGPFFDGTIVPLTYYYILISGFATGLMLFSIRKGWVLMEDQ